jgi:hypothetical protein
MWHLWECIFGIDDRPDDDLYLIGRPVFPTSPLRSTTPIKSNATFGA